MGGRSGRPIVTASCDREREDRNKRPTVDAGLRLVMQLGRSLTRPGSRSPLDIDGKLATSGSETPGGLQAYVAIFARGSAP